MTIGASFPPEYRDIAVDFRTIANCLPEIGERVNVVDGHLQIVEDEFLNIPFFNKEEDQGGNDWKDLAAYLDLLANRTSALFNNLSEASTIDLFDHQNKVRIVAKKIKLLQINGLRNDLSTEQQMMRIHEKFAEHIKLIEKFLSDKGESCPSEPIDFYESVDSRLVDFRIPKGASVDDVRRLAETAEAQKITEMEKAGLATLAGIESTIEVASALVVESAKFVLWNPIEYFFNGNIETQGPLQSALDNAEENFREMDREVDDTKIKLLLHLYASWFLQHRIVSEEHVDAFCSFSKHVNSKFSPGGPLPLYEIISGNPDELIEMAEGEIKKYCSWIDPFLLGNEAKQLIRESIATCTDGWMTPLEFAIYLTDHFSRLLWVEDPGVMPIRQEGFSEWAKAFKGTNLEERKLYFRTTCNRVKESRYAGTYIPLNLLLRVIDAIGSNPLCTEFEVSPSNAHIQRIHQKLLDHGFVQDSQSKWRYKRS